jgi:hypothetical protein
MLFLRRLPHVLLRGSFDPQSQEAAVRLCRGSRSAVWTACAAATTLLLTCAPVCHAARQDNDAETIVLMRHAEKPETGLGQLNCKGLNRALALPDVLLRRFGKPDYIYASNPAVQSHENGETYSYVRPLATIEPTAIRAGLPVNTQFGLNQIDELQTALTQPSCAHAVVFVVWEHVYLHDLARQLLTAYGDDPSILPAWPKSDYDTMYVFRISRQDGKPHLSFRVEQEGLDGKLSDTCPEVGRH